MAKSTAVHSRPEAYKIGWVHGFYDCVPDAGARYGGWLDYPPAGTTVDAERHYREGYRDGQSERRRPF